MLVFIVPLKSKAASMSWAKTSQLAEQCLRSACQQTCSAFHVILVCHDQPEIQFEHPNLTYLTASFPPPDCTLGTAEDILNRKRTDKGRKQLQGLVAAQAFEPTHTMLLDADDRVSNQLAPWVQQNPEALGWFFEQGYRYKPGNQWIYKKFKKFHTMCGSCNILRNDLNQIPAEPEYNRGYGYYSLYIDHGKVRDRLAAAGTPLQPLPFLGAVYMVQTGENIYFEASRMYQGIGKYINYRWVTPALRAEFGL